jgi:hypothetical protein
MTEKRVIVMGGQGYFGRLIVEDLRRHSDCEVLVAGRRAADLRDAASLEAALADVVVAICAAGPFQRLPITLAEICARRRIHYIDVADDRRFVRKVRSLAVNHAGNLPAVCPGWSTVSALSGLLVHIASAGMDRIDSIQIHMAPGNRGARQKSTIESLLHSVGQPFTVFRDGRWQTVQGWSEPRWFCFPSPIGRRVGYLVNVVDLELFPEMFQASNVEFRTGSELAILNRTVLLLAGRKMDWTRFAELFQRAAALLSWFGHDWGAVGVEVAGTGTRRAFVVARANGERIAAMPASVMAGLLLSGSAHSGLVSYRDWLSREQLKAECEKRGFELIVEGA